jgi:ABC-type multidrug transport system ATPase subunit
MLWVPGTTKFISTCFLFFPSLIDILIQGPNGAGKSTTIKILSGLETASYGQSRFPRSTKEVLTPNHFPGDLYQSIGFCPQHDALWGKLTPRQHLRLYACIRGCPSNELAGAVDSVLDEVGITEKDVYTEKLSGGNKRRLMLAIASIGRPELIFLDGEFTTICQLAFY